MHKGQKAGKWMAVIYKNGVLQNSDTSIIQKHHFNYEKSPCGLGGAVFKVISKMIYYSI